jgi:hypothetical protein
MNQHLFSRVALVQTSENGKNRESILTESCMPNYFIIIHKLKSLLASVFAFCRWIYVHFYVHHQHKLKNSNKELSVIPFLAVVILLQIVSNPIKNGGHPSRHRINKLGAKDLAKGVSCFTDIQCQMLVWNLHSLGFLQPSCQQLPRPMLTDTL